MLTTNADQELQLIQSKEKFFNLSSGKEQIGKQFGFRD